MLEQAADTHFNDYYDVSSGVDFQEVSTAQYRPHPLLEGNLRLTQVRIGAFFWFVTFYISWGIFWFKISFSAAALAGLSLWLQSDQKERLWLDGKSVAVRLFSAAVLYLIFWIGKVLSTAIIPFGEQFTGVLEI